MTQTFIDATDFMASAEFADLKWIFAMQAELFSAMLDADDPEENLQRVKSQIEQADVSSAIEGPPTVTRRSKMLAVFSVEIVDETVCLVDKSDEWASVTNDAENVIANLAQAGLLSTASGAPRRVVYRDTAGDWDELCHDGRGFTGFAPLGARDRDAAILATGTSCPEPRQPAPSPLIIAMIDGPPSD